jgi:hypothetical protein
MAATTPVTYTGKDAVIQVNGQNHTAIGIGDFSLTLDRGTVEQELVGEQGNWFGAGALSVEGSFSNVQWDSDVLGVTVGALINNTQIWVSGATGPKSLRFFFKSCQVTSFDISLGDASTVTEGSVDFTVLDPYNIKKLPIDGSGVRITD